MSQPIPHIRPIRAHRRGVERGQSTTEYALLLLGVAAIALLVLAWVAGTDVIGRLFDAVFDSLVGKVR